MPGTSEPSAALKARSARERSDNPQATKYLKLPLLITQSTRTALDSTWAVRRLCPTRVLNINEPVTLCEMTDAARAQEMTEPTSWSGLPRDYETALDHFESGNFLEAVRMLGTLISNHPTDGPAVVSSRAVSYLAQGSDKFDPVWQLSGK